MSFLVRVEPLLIVKQIQGIGTPDGPQNPIWTLAQEFNLENTFSNYDNVSTYNENGYSDYSHLFDEYDAADEIANAAAGTILLENLLDQTAQTGLALAGWKPKKTDMVAQAVEWWNWGQSGLSQTGMNANSRRLRGRLFATRELSGIWLRWQQPDLEWL